MRPDLMRVRMRKWCCGVVVVVGLAACGNDPVVLDPVSTLSSTLAPTATTVALAVGGDASVPVTAKNPSPDVTTPATAPASPSPTRSNTQPQPTASATTAPTATRPSITDPVPASAQGLGDIRLGDDAQDALAQLVELFGPPVEDSGWGPNQSPCENVGSRSRAVQWDGATALFATGPTETVADARDHFSAFLVYRESPIALRVTVEGVQILGRSVTDLQGDIVGISQFVSEIEGPLWVAGTDAQTPLNGNVDENGQISSVRAGLLCID
jgi:hypothetical protein